MILRLSLLLIVVICLILFITNPSISEFKNAAPALERLHKYQEETSVYGRKKNYFIFSVFWISYDRTGEKEYYDNPQTVEKEYIGIFNNFCRKGK